jgi:hypothetical protein
MEIIMKLRLVVFFGVLFAMLSTSIVSAQCPQAVRIGQLFVSIGTERGKGSMIQVSPGGGVVRRVQITNCKSRTLAYSFQAAKYANTNSDAAFVRIKVLLDNGQEEYYDESIYTHTTNYSNIRNVLTRVNGHLSWSGNPKELQIWVVPGDWGVEIQGLTVSFSQ